MNILPQEIEDIVLKYKNTVQNKINVERCYVYGSYAKGNYQKDSDIDICIVTNDNIKKYELWDLLFLSTRNIDLRIEPVGYTMDRFIDEIPLVWEVKQHGILI